jgi:hypothetical protein
LASAAKENAESLSEAVGTSAENAAEASAQTFATTGVPWLPSWLTNALLTKGPDPLASLPLALAALSLAIQQLVSVTYSAYVDLVTSGNLF